MQRVIWAMILFLIQASAHADFFSHKAPNKPSTAEIQSIFAQEFEQQLLFFLPFDFPIEIERTHATMAKALLPWVELGLINKKNTRFLAEKQMYGELREVSVGGYLYSLNQENPYVSEQGFFYGRPKLKSVLDVQQPTHINANYVTEVYLTWYVLDIPDWVQQVDLRHRKMRLLRRALESESKPFEERLYFKYQDGKWQLWDDEGRQTLF